MPTSHTGAWARPTRMRNKPCVILVFARYSSASSCLRSAAGQSTTGMPCAFAYPRTRRLKRPAMRIRWVLSSVSSDPLRARHHKRKPPGSCPTGNKHSTRSGRHSHSCRSAGPRTVRSRSRAYLAAKHMPRNARKFWLLTFATPDFCCPQGHFSRRTPRKSGTVLVGIRQRRAARGFGDPQMHQAAQTAGQPVADLMQGVSAAELTKQHRDELRPASKTLGGALATMLLDQSGKLGSQKMLEQLIEQAGFCLSGCFSRPQAVA
jgi:hypothetical protein